MYRKKLLYLSLAACMMGSTPSVNLYAQEKSTVVQSQDQEQVSDDNKDEEDNKKTEATTETPVATTATHATTQTRPHPTTAHHKKQTKKESKKNKHKNTKKKTSSKKKKKSTKETKKKQSNKNTPENKKTKDTQISIKAYEELSLEKKNNKEYVGSYIYFNQADEAWNHSGLSIHSAGCGPTAIAVCLTNLTSKWITPVDVASWGAKNGYYSSAGSVHEGIPAMVEHFGLQCEGAGTDYNKIKAALRRGDFVIGLMGPGYFTKGGHFIALVEINDQDQVTVADVGSRVRSQYKYALKDVINESKAAGAGGPFWIVKSKTKHKQSNTKNQSPLKKIPQNEAITIKLNKKNSDDVKKRKDAISNFYSIAKDNMNEFEQRLPKNLVYVGNKRSIIHNNEKRNSKINQYIENLADELNDPYLYQISQEYDFGSDKVINKTATNTFDLKAYLSVGTKAEEAN